MRHAPFIFAISFSALVTTAVAAGCGSGSGSGNNNCPAGEVCTQACPAGEVCTPADGGGTTGDGSPVTSGGDSGGTLPAGCHDAGPADDNPTCNACAYANCCKQVDDCAADPSCTGFDTCSAACDPSDIQCLLLCQDEYGPPQTVTDVGSCIQQHCQSGANPACPEPDGGQFDFDAF